MMGMFFIIVGIVLIGIALFYLLFVHAKGASDPMEIIDAQQRKVDSEAGVFENYTKRRKVESQTKFQEAVTEINGPLQIPLFRKPRLFRPILIRRPFPIGTVAKLTTR